MAHLPLDEARLRPHLREPAKRKQAPAETQTEEVATSPGWKVPAGGDLERRGLPAIGRNVRGSIRGTDPLSETIKRAERRRQ